MMAQHFYKTNYTHLEWERCRALLPSVGPRDKSQPQLTRRRLIGIFTGVAELAAW